MALEFCGRCGRVMQVSQSIASGEIDDKDSSPRMPRCMYQGNKNEPKTSLRISCLSVISLS